MTTVVSSVHLGTAATAAERLEKLGVGQDQFQRLITDAIYRKAVVVAMLQMEQAVTIASEDWVEREMAVSACLVELGLPAFDEKDVWKAAQKGITAFSRFVPKGLKRRQLLEACERAGIKLNGTVSGADCDGEDLSTEAGVLEQDFRAIMVPTDANQRPFMLNMDEHVVWAKEQGGDGLASAEETLYLILRAFLELGYVPFMGGWIRCRNKKGSGYSLGVFFGAGDGLEVGYGSLSDRIWVEGAVPRKYIALGA